MIVNTDIKENEVFKIPHTVEEANAWLERVGANDLRIAEQKCDGKSKYGAYYYDNKHVFLFSKTVESLCLCLDHVSKEKTFDFYNNPYKDWVDDEGYEYEGYNCLQDCVYFNEDMGMFVKGAFEGMYGILEKIETIESGLHTRREDMSVRVETFARHDGTGGYAYAVCDANGNKKKVSSIEDSYIKGTDAGIQTNTFVPIEVGDYYIEYCAGSRVNVSKVISIKDTYINTEMTVYKSDAQLLDLEEIRKEFGKLAPVIEYTYKKAYDPELNMETYNL